MSRRSRKRPWGQEHVPVDVVRARGGLQQVTGPGGATFNVRRIPAGAKEYLCPGCNQVIPVGAAHVVAWATEHLWGADAALAERRHWHSSCWQRSVRG